MFTWKSLLILTVFTTILWNVNTTSQCLPKITSPFENFTNSGKGFSSSEADISNMTSLYNCVTSKGIGKVTLKIIIFEKN